MMHPASGLVIHESHALQGAIFRWPIGTTSASPPSAFTPSAAFDARMVLLQFLRGLAVKIKTRFGGFMLRSPFLGVFQFCAKMRSPFKICERGMLNSNNRCLIESSRLGFA